MAETSATTPSTATKSPMGEQEQEVQPRAHHVKGRNGGASSSLFSSLPARHAARVAAIKSSSLSQVRSPASLLTATLSTASLPTSSTSASAPTSLRTRRPAGSPPVSTPSGSRVIQVRPTGMAAKPSTSIDYLVVVDKVPRMVADFDRVRTDGLADFLRLSSLMGERVLHQTMLIDTLFKVQRSFLLSACSSRVPAPGTGPRQASLVEEIKARAGDKDLKSVTDIERLQLKWIATTIPAMGWVVIRSNTASFIVEQVESGKTLVKRLRTEGNSNVVEWSKAWLKTMHLMADHVAKFHPNGLVWNNW